MAATTLAEQWPEWGCDRPVLVRGVDRYGHFPPVQMSWRV